MFRLWTSISSSPLCTVVDYTVTILFFSIPKLRFILRLKQNTKICILIIFIHHKCIFKNYFFNFIKTHIFLCIFRNRTLNHCFRVKPLTASLRSLCKYSSSVKLDEIKLNYGNNYYKAGFFYMYTFQR